MNQTQTINVWEVKEFFEKNNSFPQMSEDDKKYFLDFCRCQVKDLIQEYNRYTYHHGGLRQEAKDIEKQIEKAEVMRNAFKTHIGDA